MVRRMLLATGVTLVVALALKADCLTDWGPGPPPHRCYNDFQTLWVIRGLGDHTFPHVEYPILTALFAWVTASAVSTPQAFLLVSALALTPFALITAVALERIAGERALLFALSPLLASCAFLNWDLLPVAAVATALGAWRRQRFALTGVLLGLGVGAKIWPGFVLVPLLIGLLLERRWRDGGRLAGGAVATVLPLVIVRPEAWTGPFRMQAERVNDRTTNSIWFHLLGRHDFHAVMLWSTGAVLLAWALVLLIGLEKRPWPAVQVAAAMVSTFMLLGRVDSPQYGLWLLPFVVVLRVPAPWVVFYVAADLWLWLNWSWLPIDRDLAAALVWFALAGLTMAFLGAPEYRATECQPAGPSPGRCSPRRGRWPAALRARPPAARRTSAPG